MFQGSRFVVSAVCTLFCAVLTCCGSGCGKSGPAVASQVAGTVTLDGTPLGGAVVRFYTEQVSGEAVTDATGAFTLPNGAQVGKNKVVIQKWEGVDGMLDAEAGMDAGQLAAASAGGGDAPPVANPHPQILPPKFSDATQSELSFDVPSGGTTAADFNLTSM